MDNKETIKIKYFSLIEFVSIYLVLMLLSALPAIMYSESFEAIIYNDYTFWYMLYWFLVTCIICGITAHQKRKTFFSPLNTLSQGAKAVSQGDFSVYIKPVHSANKRDYMDSMFEDFNRMVQELGSIETLKNDFVSDVSHELKTPLAIIQNYVTLLKDETLTYDQRHNYLNTISEATQKLSHLISNILRLNKLENQVITQPFEEYDVCRQLSDCILSFESILITKDIDICIDIEDKAVIYSDQELLEVVWNNIISNAIKFTAPKGTIEIKQTSNAESITVSIRDSGCGMKEETIKHIFDKFYQGDTSHSGEGNGLGLALTYRIIEKMGGEISVISKQTEGTTFFVRLNTKKNDN